MCSEISGSHYFSSYVTFQSVFSDQRVLKTQRDIALAVQYTVLLNI